MMKEELETRFSWEIDGECWVGIKGPSLSVQQPSGKVRASFRGKAVYIDRLFFTAFRGEIGKSQILAHVCGRKDCFNPDHMELEIGRRAVVNGKSEKACTSCGVTKSVLEFPERSVPGEGRKTVCQACVDSKQGRLAESREKRALEKASAMAEKARIRKERQQLSALKKPERKKHNNERSVERFMERYKTDPILRIKHAHRRRVNNLIKAQFMAKAHPHTRALFGCTYQEYKAHLEQRFQPGMTWDNHGTVWELDHIRPLSSFDLMDEEQQRQAFHYTNVQPLFTRDNRTKGSTWSDNKEAGTFNKGRA